MDIKDKLIQVVGQIQKFPDAQIDCNIGQGPQIFLEQLHQYFSTSPHDIPVMPFDWYIKEFYHCLTDLRNKVAPCQLPEDYLFFLEYYGSFMIHADTYYFAPLGCGPMVEEWYGYFLGDEGFYKNGLLCIGSLSLYKRKDGYVHFFLDLAGTVQKYCVIEVPKWKLGALSVADVLEDPERLLPYWSKIADSFTNWLEQVAKTAGTFEHF